MHYIILYNPLSKGGSNKKVYTKLSKRLKKENHTVEVGSLLDIKNIQEYLDGLNKTDKIVIVGGDGTMHYLANTLMNYQIENDIYALKKSGTGNDFLRSLKAKGRLVKINDYIKDIPYDSCDNDEFPQRHFLNSAGMGVDAYIAYLVNEKEGSKSKWSYFKSTYKGFMKYKPYAVKVTIDGKVEEFKKTWIAIVANGKYLAGGMNISPKSERLDDKIELVVIQGIPKFLVFFVFPLIYFGWHTILTRWIKFYQGEEITIEADVDNYVQYDGETFYPRRKIKAHRR